MIPAICGHVFCEYLSDLQFGVLTFCPEKFQYLNTNARGWQEFLFNQCSSDQKLAKNKLFCLLAGIDLSKNHEFG